MPNLLARFFRPTPPAADIDKFDRDPAFVVYPRPIELASRDPWRLDFWRGSLPQCPKLTHMLACSHLRPIASGRSDRRSPHLDEPEMTHQFFLLFTEPPESDRYQVCRFQLDLGHELLQEATASLSAAQAEHRALVGKERSLHGESLHRGDRLLREIGRARREVVSIEGQIDREARNVCEAIALAMETAKVWQLTRTDKRVDLHWQDVAGFAALSLPLQKARQKNTPLGKGVVRGVILPD